MPRFATQKIVASILLLTFSLSNSVTYSNVQTNSILENPSLMKTEGIVRSPFRSELEKFVAGVRSEARFPKTENVSLIEGERPSSNEVKRAEARSIDNRIRKLRVEGLEDRNLLSASAWQNPNNPFDVNNDGSVTPADAKIVLDDLVSAGAHQLDGFPSNTSHYVDTSGNNTLSPVDLLRVINHLGATQISSDPNHSYYVERSNGSSVVYDIWQNYNFITTFIKQTAANQNPVFQAVGVPQTSPDGNYLFMGLKSQNFYSTYHYQEFQIEIFNVRTGKPESSIQVESVDNPNLELPTSINFVSPYVLRLAYASGAEKLFDVTTKHEVPGPPVPTVSNPNITVVERPFPANKPANPSLTYYDIFSQNKWVTSFIKTKSFNYQTTAASITGLDVPDASSKLLIYGFNSYTGYTAGTQQIEVRSLTGEVVRTISLPAFGSQNPIVDIRFAQGSDELIQVTFQSGKNYYNATTGNLVPDVPAGWTRADAVFGDNEFNPLDLENQLISPLVQKNKNAARSEARQKQDFSLNAGDAVEQSVRYAYDQSKEGALRDVVKSHYQYVPRQASAAPIRYQGAFVIAPELGIEISGYAPRVVEMALQDNLFPIIFAKTKQEARELRSYINRFVSEAEVKRLQYAVVVLDDIPQQLSYVSALLAHYQIRMVQLHALETETYHDMLKSYFSNWAEKNRSEVRVKWHHDPQAFLSFVGIAVSKILNNFSANLKTLISA